MLLLFLSSAPFRLIQGAVSKTSLAVGPETPASQHLVEPAKAEREKASVVDPVASTKALAPSGDALKPNATISAAGKIQYGDPRYREALLQGCGEVCDTTIKGEPVQPGQFISFVRKHINCPGIMSNVKSDAARPGPIIRKIADIPAKLMDDFTMSGLSPYCTRCSRRLSAQVYGLWTPQLIDAEMNAARRGVLAGTYGLGTCNQVMATFRQHADEIRGKHFFVIGSQRPWVEAMLLVAGAAHVTTIEYGPLNSTDPRITIAKPWDISRLFLESGGAEPKFDGGATFSSVEHAGLNRYGDAINPWGDLVAMAKAWCITKPGGPMFMGVPSGKDGFKFYANRIYGKHRYPQLMANWRQSSLQTIKGLPGREDQKMIAFARDDGK